MVLIVVVVIFWFLLMLIILACLFCIVVFWGYLYKNFVSIKTRKKKYICCQWHPQSALKPTTIVCDEKDALEFAFEMEVEFGSQKKSNVEVHVAWELLFCRSKPTKMHGIHLIIIHQVFGHYFVINDDAIVKSYNPWMMWCIVCQFTPHEHDAKILTQGKSKGLVR